MPHTEAAGEVASPPPPPATANRPRTPEPRPAAVSRLSLPVILLAVFTMPIAISGTAVSLPHIADSLGASPTPLQWVVNGFNAAFAVSTLVWGVAADRFGTRLTFVSGLALMTVGSALSALADGLGTLDAARIVAGAGAGAIITSTATTLSKAWPAAARARNFALFGTVIGLGGAIGPTLAGLLISWTGWRGVFVFYGAVSLLALLLSRSVPGVRPEHSGQRQIDFSLLRNRRFLALALVPVAQAVGFMTVFTYLPVALSAEHGVSSSDAGLLLLLMTVPILIGPTLAARGIARLRRFTPKSVVHGALLLLVLGDAGLFLLSPGRSLWWVVVPMVVLGFAWGLPAGLVDGEAIATVPPESAGTAAGVLNFLRVGGEALAIALYAAAISALIARDADPGVAHRTAAGVVGHGELYASAFRWVLLVLLLLSALLGTFVVLLHREPRRTPVRDGTA